MQEIVLSEDGSDVTLGVCLETRGGRLAPHILPFHGLGTGLLFKEDVSKASFYDLDTGNGTRKVLLSVLV